MPFLYVRPEDEWAPNPTFSNLIDSKFNLIGPTNGANLVIFMRNQPTGVSFTLPRTWISFLEMLELPTEIIITGSE